MSRAARLLAVVALLLASVPLTAGEGGSWSPVASLAVARQETGAARIGDQVYVVGGLVVDPSFGATTSVEAYDVGADTYLEQPGRARDVLGGCCGVIVDNQALANGELDETKGASPNLDVPTPNAPASDPQSVPVWLRK